MSVYHIRDPKKGDVGPIRSETVVDLVRAGVFTEGALVSCDGGPFVPIAHLNDMVAPPPWFDLHMGIRPFWDNIALIRASLINHLATVFQEQAYCDALTMVVGELMENAIKYGAWGRPGEPTLRLRIEGDAVIGARVQVRNPVEVESPHVDLLLGAIMRLRSCKSTYDAYTERMLEIAGQGAQSEGAGGLGLFRVAHEGRCVLDADIDEDAFLRVEAQFTLKDAMSQPIASV